MTLYNERIGGTPHNTIIETMENKGTIQMKGADDTRKMGVFISTMETMDQEQWMTPDALKT